MNIWTCECIQGIILGKQYESTGILQNKKKTYFKSNKKHKRKVVTKKEKLDGYGFEGE